MIRDGSSKKIIIENSTKGEKGKASYMGVKMVLQWPTKNGSDIFKNRLRRSVEQWLK